MLLENEIRLLSLLPASDAASTTPIKCDIIIAALSDNPDYEALSYVWGSEPRNQSIQLAGCDVSISPTLHSALLRLRLPDRTRTLWIDQLCINQQDLDEKMQQVQLMRHIYTSCSRCIIWMGEIQETIRLEDAHAAFQFLHYMSEVHCTGIENAVVPSVDNVEGMVKAIWSLGYGHNQWWERIWTVQEASLPKDLTMQWGPLTLPWSILDNATWNWTDPEVVNTDELSRALGGVMIHAIWLDGPRNGVDDLYCLIHKWRHRKASDVRDKIYGLLGLCETGILPRTERCDYSLSPAEVFSTLTRELILHDKELKALTPYLREDSSNTTPDMPSWAIDLGSTGQVDVPDLWHQLNGYQKYCASKGLNQIDLELIRSEMGQSSLSLRGVCVDKIIQIEKGYKKSQGWEINFSKTECLIRSWYNVAMREAADGTCEAQSSLGRSEKLYPGERYSCKEAFLRCILGDVIRNHENVPVRDLVDKDLEDAWKMVSLECDGVDWETRRTVYGMMANQNMFVTKLGLIGTGHMDVQVGDEVWILNGGKVPFTIRPRVVEVGFGHTFVGHCYVQGIMFGEAGEKSISGVDLTERTACLW
ncbi:HET-domain-containing protein [Periconia macrospinosa]|uniref:HET-domain-containing protein n=1 Tax=Periconia macrospinosa TaxID=97972 RepID=A0A2V1E074_9PLEO|nr:HET-domain-containing protein [Periconia macrospinosa]